MGYSAGQGGPERGDAFRRQDLQQTPHTMLASPLGAYGLPATSPYAQHLQAFNPGFGLSPEGLTQAFRGQLSPSTLPHTPGFATPDAYFRDREQLAHLQAFGHMSGGSNPNAAQQFTPGPFANPGQTQPSPRQGDPGYGPPDSVMEAEMMRRLHQGFPNAEGVPTHAAAPASQTQGGARSPPDPTPHREPPSNDAPQADHKREHMPAREENGDEGEGEGSDGTEDDFYYKKENGGVTELAQVGEDQVELPIELFDLPSLNRILSIQTWNQHLNDEERLHLLKFLPQLPDVHLQDTLDKLLKGANFNFGSPMQELWERLQGGECSPRVARYAEGLLYLQKKEHTHRLREYHNSMVNNLVQMRSLWQQFPTAELPERLAMWERFSRNEPLNKTAPLKPLPPSPEAPPAPVEETVKKESENVGALENGPEQERPKKKAGKKGDESAKKSEDAGGKTSAEKKGGKASAEKKGAKASPEKKGGKGKKVSDEAPAGGDGETSQEEKPVKKVKRKQPPKEEPAPAPKKAKLDLEKDPEAEPSSQNDAPNQVADESQSFQPLRVLAAVRGALLDSESPALSTSEVEEAVRENPGDPSVLSAPAPGFTEIVRAALRALSTKPVDLGTKKALAKFDRESKTWAWTGPRPLADEDLGAAETGAGAWRIEPEFQKQVVDNFLTRLKQPKKEPVSEAPANADPGEAPGPSESEKVEPAGGSGRGEEEEGGKKQVKRRVKKEEGQEKEKGGAAKGAVVPPPLKSTPEQLERFQKEEWMRYMAPEKTFRYTAADGGLSMVAGIRGAGKGKSKGKAREHFMLKSDRPPEVTILCLVRDAAARFHEGVGTRADVCSLIRESRYINEDVPENQLNNIVSGAMDRLHYEADPCIRFDSERKVWIYLHRDRAEADFQQDGTKNTRKWAAKRKKPGDDQEGDEEEGDPPEEAEEKPKPKKRAKKELAPGDGADPPKEKKKRKSKAQQKAEEAAEETMTSAGPMTSAKADESDSEDQVLAAGLGQRARSVSEKPAGRSESEVDGPPVVYTGGVNGGADYGGAVVMQPVGYVDDNAPLDYPGSQPRRLIDLQEAAEDEEENEDEEDEEETDDEET